MRRSAPSGRRGGERSAARGEGVDGRCGPSAASGRRPVLRHRPCVMRQRLRRLGPVWTGQQAQKDEMQQGDDVEPETHRALELLFLAHAYGEGNRDAGPGAGRYRPGRQKNGVISRHRSTATDAWQAGWGSGGYTFVRWSTVMRASGTG